MKKIVKTSAKKVTAAVVAGATLLSNFSVVSAVPIHTPVDKTNANPIHVSANSVRNVINKETVANNIPTESLIKEDATLNTVSTVKSELAKAEEESNLEFIQEATKVDEESVQSTGAPIITKENDKVQNEKSENEEIYEDVNSEISLDSSIDDETSKTTETTETKVNDEIKDEEISGEKEKSKEFSEVETPEIKFDLGKLNDVTPQVQAKPEIKFDLGKLNDITPKAQAKPEIKFDLGKLNDITPQVQAKPEIKFDLGKLNDVTPQVQAKPEIKFDLGKLNDITPKAQAKPEIKFDSSKLLDAAVEAETPEVSSPETEKPIADLVENDEAVVAQEANKEVVEPEQEDKYADEKENGKWKKPENNIWTNITEETDYSGNEKITVHYEGAHVYVSFAKFQCNLEMCDGFDGAEEITVGRRGGSDYEITAPQAKPGYHFSHWTKTTVTETTYTDGNESSFSYDVYKAVYEKNVEEVAKSQYNLYSTDRTINVNPEITIKTNLTEDDLKKYGTENEPGSGIIWWVEFSCDMNMCEGFDQHFSNNKGTIVLEGRRGSSDLTMTAPEAKPGYHFVGWEKYETNHPYNGEVGVMGYRAIYAADV